MEFLNWNRLQGCWWQSNDVDDCSTIKNWYLISQIGHQQSKCLKNMSSISVELLCRFILATVLLVTLTWQFRMLVTEFWCWPTVGDIFWILVPGAYIKRLWILVTKMAKPSPQHRRVVINRFRLQHPSPTPMKPFIFAKKSVWIKRVDLGWYLYFL